MDCEVIFDVDAQERHLAELEKKIEQPDFWDNDTEARRLLKERKVVSTVIDTWKSLHTQWEENRLLL